MKDVPTEQLKLELAAIKIRINSEYTTNVLKECENYSMALRRVREISAELKAREPKKTVAESTRT